jgi:hypothetical protein
VRSFADCAEASILTRFATSSGHASYFSERAVGLSRLRATSSGGISVAGSRARRWRAKIRTTSSRRAWYASLSLPRLVLVAHSTARFMGHVADGGLLAEADEAHQPRPLGLQLEPERAAHGQVLLGPNPQRAHWSAPGHGRASGRRASWPTLA